MQKLFILLIGIIVISCNQTTKEKPKTDTKATAEMTQSENFDWLIGQWQRLDEEEGKETFENWDKVNGKAYAGIGFTMQNGDTIKQEKIQLIKSEGHWDLTVKVPEEAESITFNGVSHSANEFTCENKELDFPNRIKYWKKGNRLHARVSGDDMSIPFEFKRLK